MSTAQRTKTGCWTCRLRRKKCNEGGPPCVNCESRGVFCHGYGPKPPWKDRGEKEREQASRLQLQTRKRRGASMTLAGGLAQQCSLPNASTDKSDFDPEVIAPEIPSPSQSDFSLSSLSSSQERQAFELLDSLEMFGPWDAPDTSNEILLGPSLAEAQTGVDEVQHQKEVFQTDSSDDAVGVCNNLWRSPSSARPLNTIADFHTPATDLQPRPAICFPPAAPAPVANVDERETELVMYFIGETFAVQHSSYRAASTMQRSWLLQLLMRSPTFYYASLSMSAYHYYTNLSGDSEARRTTFEAYQRYRTCAMIGFHELQSSDRPPFSSSGSVPGECMICGVQIALLEAFGKNMQESQSHLSSAAQSLLNDGEIVSACPGESPRVRTASIPTFPPQQLITPIVSPSVPPAVATSKLSSMERKAYGFFRALLVWNDILSCSARKKHPLGVEIYQKLLANEDFAQSLRDTVGCESWVLIAILDATSLEVWKQNQEAQANLSIRELVSRAGKIESVLEQGIERLSTILQGLTPVADIASYENAHSDRIQYVQTYIFAHSVLTHLHTIVSGSWPGVPEIQQSIDRAVSAWELYRSVINLKTLTWPYCVSASLAVGLQRDTFRKLISEASPRESTLGSLVDLRSVVEECWRGFDQRKSERNVSCDWKEVMQRLNLSVMYA